MLSSNRSFSGGLQRTEQVVPQQGAVAGEPQRKPQQKVNQHVVAIDSARKSPGPIDEPPQPPVNAAKANRYSRRSFLRMFLLGNGVRKLSRFHKVPEPLIEGELREELIKRGAFNEPEVRKAAA